MIRRLADVNPSAIPTIYAGQNLELIRSRNMIFLILEPGIQR